MIFKYFFLFKLHNIHILMLPPFEPYNLNFLIIIALMDMSRQMSWKFYCCYNSLSDFAGFYVAQYQTQFIAEKNSLDGNLVQIFPIKKKCVPVEFM